MGRLLAKLWRIANCPLVKQHRIPRRYLARLSLWQRWIPWVLPSILYAAWLCTFWLVMPNITTSERAKKVIFYVLCVAGMAGSVAYMGFYIAYYQRLRQQILDIGYMVCPHCHYHLEGLPRKHVCPECGRAYDGDELQRQWEKDFPAPAGQT